MTAGPEPKVSAEQLREARIDAAVKANVATWPDLTPERTEQLRRLLAPGFARLRADAESKTA